MTLFVIPAAQPGPRPVVTRVANAASYLSPVAPGQMVVVWGTNLGPAPAHPGETVVLWGTGEGVTDPPGVDGRLATGVFAALRRDVFG